MTAIVALLDRLQDVCGIILTTTESLDAAGFGSWWRCRACLLRVIRIRRMVWPLRRDDLDASLIERRR